MIHHQLRDFSFQSPVGPGLQPPIAGFLSPVSFAGPGLHQAAAQPMVIWGYLYLEESGGNPDTVVVEGSAIGTKV